MFRSLCYLSKYVLKGVSSPNALKPTSFKVIGRKLVT
ncbi:hypothetical protein SLEP1_g12632 [Rubroshorea leprosula]|uniref:Uncharacterized protein n=1 Tax=Rubroshorea leprosula TaxID=152421 RepID=A0AAV5IMB4_9ROSI|nr:hypothetical protein SLEP1_g12632 [Rubroshorea leprosula]